MTKKNIEVIKQYSEQPGESNVEILDNEKGFNVLDFIVENNLSGREVPELFTVVDINREIDRDKGMKPWEIVSLYTLKGEGEGRNSFCSVLRAERTVERDGVVLGVHQMCEVIRDPYERYKRPKKDGRVNPAVKEELLGREMVGIEYNLDFIKNLIDYYKMQLQRYECIDYEESQEKEFFLRELNKLSNNLEENKDRMIKEGRLPKEFVSSIYYLFLDIKLFIDNEANKEKVVSRGSHMYLPRKFAFELARKYCKVPKRELPSFLRDLQETFHNILIDKLISYYHLGKFADLDITEEELEKKREGDIEWGNKVFNFYITLETSLEKFLGIDFFIDLNIEHYYNPSEKTITFSISEWPRVKPMCDILLVNTPLINDSMSVYNLFMDYGLRKAIELFLPEDVKFYRALLKELFPEKEISV